MEIPEREVQRLARRPEAALPLSRIPELLEAGPTPGPRETLRGAARHPELLRVVDLWKGPWRTLAPDPATLPPDVRAELARQGIPAATWLVPLAPCDRSLPGRPALRRLQETVRYLGRVVDVDSPQAVTRWIRIVRECGLVDPGD